MIKPIVKTRAKALTQVMKVSVLPYNGKKQVSRMWTTPLEIGISVDQQAPTIIGPVQEIQSPILRDECSYEVLESIGEKSVVIRACRPWRNI